MLDRRVLQLLVCPETKAPLILNHDKTELWCKASGWAYPLRDGIPVLLVEQARALTAQEKEDLL